MNKYKKYILFQFDGYSPAGGLGDIVGSFNSVEEAIEHAKKNMDDCNEIIDRDTWEKVANLNIIDIRTDELKADQIYDAPKRLAQILNKEKTHGNT